MKRALFTLSCVLPLLLSACGVGQTALPTVTTATPIPPPTDTPSPSPVDATITPTPVGVFGWRTVSGVVYADAAGPGHELAGAVVRCAQSSYSQVEGSCAPYEVTTGPDGEFSFDLFVRDTDTIRLSAEKEGHEPAELQVRGFDCVVGCPNVGLVLVTRAEMRFLNLAAETPRTLRGQTASLCARWESSFVAVSAAHDCRRGIARQE
jgi:hypothetical protein